MSAGLYTHLNAIWMSFVEFGLHYTCNVVLRKKCIALTSSFQESKIWLAKQERVLLLKCQRVGLGRVEWDVLHTSEINRHIQTIFSHSVTPTMFLNANEEGYRHVSSSAVSSTHCLTPHSQPRPSNLPTDTKAYVVWHILPDTKSTRVIMRKTCQIKRPLLAHSSFSERRE